MRSNLFWFEKLKKKEYETRENARDNVFHLDMVSSGEKLGILASDVGNDTIIEKRTLLIYTQKKYGPLETWPTVIDFPGLNRN